MRDEDRREKGVKSPSGLDIAGQDKKPKKGMRALKKWFGDESVTDDTETESSEDEGDGEEVIIARESRNRERRKRNRLNRKERERESAKKASRIIGLGPIMKQSIDHYEKQTGDREAGRRKAVREYMEYFLKFEEKNINEMEIMETQCSGKNDNVVYVAFKDIEPIKMIHARMAQEILQARNYIPPQYFKKYMFLSRGCNEYRKENIRVKTQMRFTERGIEILMKEKGSEDPYRSVRYEEIVDTRDIPKL